jgi:hypothetical protein
MAVVLIVAVGFAALLNANQVLGICSYCLAFILLPASLLRGFEVLWTMDAESNHFWLSEAVCQVVFSFFKCLSISLIFMGHWFLVPFLLRGGIPAHKPPDIAYGGSCFLWGFLFLGVYPVGLLVRLLREEVASNPILKGDLPSREARDT